MTALRDQLTIRPAQTADLARVAEIYNAGIAERVATFETTPRTIDDVRSWSRTASRSSSRSTTTR
jgi:L-amino acid N-acyltransferase YncA